MKVRFLFLITSAIGIYGLNTFSKTEDRPNIDCQQISAYYKGTFQYPYNRSWTFDAQLEVTVNINLSDKRIYFKVNNFNKTLSKGYEFNLFDDNYGIRCKTGQQQPCSMEFSSLSSIRVDFWPFGEYNPFLIMLKSIPINSFTVLNTIGNCGTALQNNDLSDTDRALYDSCFCCGDKYNPDPSLGCLASPWN